jgi:hypothetical protein
MMYTCTEQEVDHLRADALDGKEGRTPPSVLAQQFSSPTKLLTSTCYLPLVQQ